MQHADAPTINRLAERIFGAQVVRRPVSPLGYATINDEAGQPIATVAVVLGRGNPEMLESLLEQLKGELHPVEHDIMPPPEGPEGPGEAAESKKEPRHAQSTRTEGTDARKPAHDGRR